MTSPPTRLRRTSQRLAAMAGESLGTADDIDSSSEGWDSVRGDEGDEDRADVLLEEEEREPTAGSRTNGTFEVKWKLFPTRHPVIQAKYATSTDSRGFIPVFEYPLGNQTMMIDTETGYVSLTGIWKALGHHKADVVKLIESQPDIANVVRKVRGGYLKIQGTWLPYEIARSLARRVAWEIRDDLIPLFGPDFPSQCIPPGMPGFGQLILSTPKGRRRNVKDPNARAAAQAAAQAAQNNSSVTTQSQVEASKTLIHKLAQQSVESTETSNVVAPKPKSGSSSLMRSLSTGLLSSRFSPYPSIPFRYPPPPPYTHSSSRFSRSAPHLPHTRSINQSVGLDHFPIPARGTALDYSSGQSYHYYPALPSPTDCSFSSSLSSRERINSSESSSVSDSSICSSSRDTCSSASSLSTSMSTNTYSDSQTDRLKVMSPSYPPRREMPVFSAYMESSLRGSPHTSEDHDKFISPQSMPSSNRVDLISQQAPRDPHSCPRPNYADQVKLLSPGSGSAAGLPGTDTSSRTENSSHPRLVNAAAQSANVLGYTGKAKLLVDAYAFASKATEGQGG